MKPGNQHPAEQQGREAPSFKALMLVYELLYYKLEQLLGQHEPPEILVSRPVGAQPLYYQRLETHTYVTLDHLSYRFPLGEQRHESEPDAVIKRYHDLKTAELVSCVPDLHVARYSHPDTAMGAALKGRWQMNRFLLKWCDHLLDQGHCLHTFQPISRQKTG